jgi:hypothetical protein
MPSKDKRDQQTTNVGKPDREIGTCPERSEVNLTGVLIVIERHRSIQDTRKFYNRLNVVKRLFEAQVVMCRAKNGELLTNKEGTL